MGTSRTGPNREANRRVRVEEGARLLREVLRAIPPELDEPEDAVLREIVKGAANAADVAAKSDELERPPEV